MNETGKLEIRRKLRRSELSSFFEKQESRTVRMEASARRITGRAYSPASVTR